MLKPINSTSSKNYGSCHRCRMANVLDCDIVVSEFEIHSRNYVHFRTYSLKKGINALLQPDNGYTVIQRWFWD